MDRDTAHLGATALTEAAGAPATTNRAVRAHLLRCVVCRVRLSRLRHADPGASTADDTTVARVLAASVAPPTAAGRFAGPLRRGTPRAGDLWRAGAEDVVLVWVRRVVEGVADVLPVVLDVGLADETTLLVPAAATELGTELAVVTTVRATVDVRFLLDRVADLDGSVGRDVEEVIAAGRTGRHPQGVEVGAPVLRPDDPRIEYRQVLADLLADLAPISGIRRKGPR